MKAGRGIARVHLGKRWYPVSSGLHKKKTGIFVLAVVDAATPTEARAIMGLPLYFTKKDASAMADELQTFMPSRKNGDATSRSVEIFSVELVAKKRARRPG